MQFYTFFRIFAEYTEQVNSSEIKLSTSLAQISSELKFATRGQRILTKGRIACRAVIEDGMIPSNVCRY